MGLGSTKFLLRQVGVIQCPGLLTPTCSGRCIEHPNHYLGCLCSTDLCAMHGDFLEVRADVLYNC